MPLIVPYVAAPTPPPVVTVTSPGLRVVFTDGTLSVTVSGLLTAQTQIGRASPRTDAAGSGTATLTFKDTQRVLDPDNTSSSLYGHLTPGGKTTVQLSAWNGTSWVPLFTGLIESITTTYTPNRAEASVSLVDAARDLALHIPPANVQYPLQQSGARIAQMVGATARSGWHWTNRAPSGAFNIDAGQKVLKPITTDGSTSTWQYITNAALAEKGVVFFDQGGVLNYQDQLHRYQSSTPRWTFGDSHTTEVWIDQSLTYSLNNDRMLTDVAYATGDGITSGYGPGGVFSWTTTSNTTNTSQVTSTDTDLADQMQGLSRARWEYNHYSINRRDAQNVAVDAHGEWPSVSGVSRFGIALNAQLGDYVQLNRRPTVGSMISKYYWIDMITHTISYDSWTATFTLAAADAIPPFYKLGVTPLASMTAPLPW